ncbi:MAG: hypothetical protein QGF36_06765 [Candidatus Marinimicrobia bacterium]|nr:hypothetical protein [Candidatus Neomarinimicrobiota bacterium]
MLTKTIVFFLGIFPAVVLPCAVCYGNPEDPLSQGMNMGILTLLGFIGLILGIIAASIISLSLRTRKLKNT